MRILILSQACFPTMGGVESHLEDIIRSLPKQGHEVHLAVGKGLPGRRSGSTVHNLTELAQLDRFSHKFNPTDSSLEELSQFISSLAPDIIHIHNPNHFSRNLSEMLLRLTQPVIVGVHDRPTEPEHDSVLSLPWNHTLHASEYLSRAMPNPAQHSVLHLGVDLKLFSPEGETHPALTNMEPPIIFHPARLLRWKGVIEGVQAFVKIREKLRVGSLVLTDSSNTHGDAEEIRQVRLEIEDIVDRAGIQRNVVFRDFDHQEMPAVYRGVDLVWYPTTRKEPYGLVPLEAMACGAPPIVTNSGGLPETVLHRQSGMILEPKEIAQLDQVALPLLTDNKLRKQLSTGAVVRSKSFSIETYTNALLERYSKAMTNGL